MERLLNKKILYVYGLKDRKGCIVVDEDNKHLEYRCSALTFVKRLCKLYGTTYEYQRNQSLNILSGLQKMPIVIKESRKYILFPIGNQKGKQTIWMNYEMIQKVGVSNYYFSDVYFKSGHHFCLRQNNRIIKKQMQRCKKLMLFLESL